MYYKPQDLKLVSIQNLPVGTLAEYVQHAGVEKFIRLADAENGQARILILGGEYTFTLADWKHSNDLARVICHASELRVGLGASSEVVSHTDPGVLVVYEDGAYISCQREKRSFERPKLSLSTWAVHEGNQHPSLLYPLWDLGYLDAKHNFQALFSKAN